MNAKRIADPDPDPNLSAYLDGELDDAGRSSFESAISASPCLRADLGDYARVRDLIANLPRPEPDRDFSATILEAISRTGRSSRERRRRLLVGLTVGACLAASLLLVATRFGRASRPSSPRLDVAEASRRPVDLPRPLPTPGTRPARPTPGVLPVDVAILPSVLAVEEKARDDRGRLRTLLGRGEARQIVVVVDALGPATLDALDDAIRQSNRRVPEHARILLVQDVAIGPDGPGVVYALAMDEVEHDLFRRKLEERFPKALSESGPPAANLLVSLGSIGRIEIREGEPRSTLMDPPHDLDVNLGIRQPKLIDARDRIVDRDGRIIADNHAKDSSRSGTGTPPLDGPRGFRAGDVQGPPLARPRPPIAGDPPIAVYLVWLRERGPRRG